MPVEHRNLEPGLHADRHFAAAIRGHRLEQQLSQIGPTPSHFIKERGRTHQKRVAARLGLAQAQQPDHVAGVGVEGLTLGRLVDAHVRVGAGQTDITNMPKQVACRIL